jgi:hypothetical protein
MKPPSHCNKIVGVEAKAAVPVLMEASSHGGDYHKSALLALKKVDPQAAAKVRRGN